jgi:uncharacterized membrane protein (UPF0127 family)
LAVCAAVAVYTRAAGGTAAFTDVSFKDVRVHAEIAGTDYDRQRGLMYRESLGADEGMLFVFVRESVLSFWMMNTLIPLDLIWISKDKKVVYIAAGAQPCGTSCENIVPPVQAQYVLEVNAGFAQARGIAVGDRVDFR